MLMSFPGDFKNNEIIAKAVSGFGLLRYWHDTKNIERVVARMLLHDDAKIPHDVTIAVGLPPRIRSWTCPVFILKKKGATLLADEDPVLLDGVLHPLPPDAPRWIGPIYPPAGSVSQGDVGRDNFSVGDAEMQQDNHAVVMSGAALDLDVSAPNMVLAPANASGLGNVMHTEFEVIDLLNISF